MKKQHLNRKKSERGLTLIELMVALLLGVFLTAGAIQMFVGSKQSYRMQENLSRLQENGRFAMYFITRDIRGAGFWGCLQDRSNISNDLNPAGTNYSADIHDFSVATSGVNGTVDGTNPGLDLPDSIILKGAYDSGVKIVPNGGSYGPFTRSNIKVSADNDLKQGDIVLLSDCSQGDIFQITNPVNNSVLVHNTGNATEPGNYNPDTCTAGHCLSKVFKGDAQVFKLQTITYSIQTGASGSPALFRQIDADPATEIVEGVENMQILYGVDNDQNNTADYYVPAGTAGLDFSRVISVRVSLLIQTIEDNLAKLAVNYIFNGSSVTPADKRLRHVVSSTIALRNKLP